MKFQKEKNKITMGTFPNYFIIAAVLLVMSFMMIYETWSLMSMEDYELFDLIVPSIFVVVMWALTVYCLKRATAKIEINDGGVVYRDMLTSYSYRWAEIKDYGISYYGNGRSGGTYYNFYFSREKQEIKNEDKKKLRGKMIILLLDYEEITGVRDKVIPFCTQRTKVIPFISKTLTLW